MHFEAGVAIAIVAMSTAFVVDWPRALAGFLFGAILRYLPYSTILFPFVCALIAGAMELIYPVFGRTPAPSMSSFFVGYFSVAATASGLHVLIRNLRDRL
ncbi:MAG: hypothetical protein JSR78_04265 [Proteobacteria bacterium]|nr:hypothetical protein [Pseudomonadota bacterium]